MTTLIKAIKWLFDDLKHKAPERREEGRKVGRDGGKDRRRKGGGGGGGRGEGGEGDRKKHDKLYYVLYQPLSSGTGEAKER